MPGVLLLSDSTLVSLGLQSLFEAAGWTVSTALTRDAMSWLDLLDMGPDVVILDSDPPDRSLGVCTHVTNAHPDIPVLVHAATTEKSFVRAALESGARGYVCSDTEPEKLIDAARHLVEGGAVLDPRVTPSVLDWAVSPDETPQVDVLTRREREVLYHVSQGASNKRIAKHLGITEHTVKTYVKRAAMKLGCHSRASAAAAAQKYGWI